MEQVGRPLRGDSNSIPLQAPSYICDILNVSVGSDSWTAIELGSAVGSADACKYVEAGMRDATMWRFSHEAGGDRYRTILGSTAFSMDIAKIPGEVLFYVQSEEDSGTFEVVLFD